MQGFAQGYSIGGTPIYSQYTNSSFSLGHTTAGVANLDIDEVLFLVLSVFFIYCYLGLLRVKVPSNARISSSTGNFEATLSSLRKRAKMSGLTHEDIENRLKSFTVDVERSDNVLHEPTTKDGPGYCEISFGQESCAICLEGYCRNEDARVRELPCDHIFHRGTFL